MQKPVSANTQHGDFVGTISIDGHQGAYAFDLAKKTEMPETFFPVGFKAFKGPSGEWKFYLYAVDVEVAGSDVEEILKYSQANTLSVEEFEVDMTSEELLHMSKQISLSVKVAGLKEIDLYPS